MQREPVDDRAHRVLAHAEVDVAALVGAGGRRDPPSSIVVSVEGDRSAAPPTSVGTVRGRPLDHRRPRPCGWPSRPRRPGRSAGGPRPSRAAAQPRSTSVSSFRQVGVLRLVGGGAPSHSSSNSAPRSTASPEVRERLLGHPERLERRPAVGLLGQLAPPPRPAALPCALAVSCLFGRAEADVRAQDDERGPVLHLHRGAGRRLDPIELDAPRPGPARASRRPRSARPRPRRRPCFVAPSSEMWLSS